MKRYEAVPHRLYRNLTNGATASIYGAVPWQTDGEAKNWRVVENGWTVHDRVNNTTGVYACPSGSSKEHAETVADKLNTMTDDIIARSVIAKRNAMHTEA